MQLYDCELFVVEQLTFDLQVFHPYRYVRLYAADAGVDDSFLETAWHIVNDSMRARFVWLAYPPHIVALAALYMASVWRGQDVG